MFSTRYLLNKLPLAVAALAVLSFTQAANAGLILKLDDGTTTETIYDENFAPGTSPDALPGVGLVGFSGSIGVWLANVSTGVGAPLIGGPFPEIDLNSVNVSGGAGTLVISLTQTGNAPASPITSLLFMLGGTTDGTVTQSYCLGISVFGCELGSGPVFGPVGPGAFSTTSGASIATPGLYDMTVITTITHTAAGQITSFNANLAAVPEPGMLTLLGIGLLGLGLTNRRRKIA